MRSRCHATRLRDLRASLVELDGVVELYESLPLEHDAFHREKLRLGGQLSRPLAPVLAVKFVECALGIARGAFFPAARAARSRCFLTGSLAALEALHPFAFHLRVAQFAERVE